MSADASCSTRSSTTSPSARRAEQALQQSEEKYRNIFNYAPVGIFQTSRDGQILTANASLAHILGYGSAEELLQTTKAVDLWAEPREREELYGAYEARGSMPNVETRWRKKDGAPIWVQINAHVVESPAGRYFEGFVYDITERKRAEEFLANTSAQRKAVLEAATRVSIIATDAEGVITVFNSGAERMLGYAAADMISKHSLIELHRPQEIYEHGVELSQELKRPISGFDVLVLRAAREGSRRARVDLREKGRQHDHGPALRHRPAPRRWLAHRIPSRCQPTSPSANRPKRCCGSSRPR